MGQKVLAQVLRRLPEVTSDRLLVGSNTSDDAGVYQLDRNRALVQTVDFFTPIVDDPYQYGQIAAANSLSDVYAMGGRPLTALNILAMPPDDVPPEVIVRILKGGARKVKEAGCLLVGGHSIKNPEPVYGLSVTGLVSPRRMITNAGALPGDLLILTKPLGTGIVSTGIKRGLASMGIARRSIRSMVRLNAVGAELGERGLVHGGTDVTGFGLLGHLRGMCEASHVAAEIVANHLPVLGRAVWELIGQDCVPGGTRQNMKSVEDVVEFQRVEEAYRIIAADAQTSGGLLLAVRPRKLEKVLETLRSFNTGAAAVIGRVLKANQPRKPMIRVIQH